MLTATSTRMPEPDEGGPENILIAGLGNLLLRDDGVGVHAVRRLQSDPPPGALVVEVGCAILDALHLFEWADRVLAIDAMAAGGAPGTIYRFGPRDVADAGCRTSLHEMGLIGGLHLIPRETWPEISILGVEPAVIEYGLELSPAVEAALPRLIAEARAVVAVYRTIE